MHRGSKYNPSGHFIFEATECISLKFGIGCLYYKFISNKYNPVNIRISTELTKQQAYIGKAYHIKFITYIWNI